MPARTLSAGCALAAVALAACGSTTKPVAGSGATRTLPGGLAAGRGVIDDPRTKSAPCLQATKLRIVRVGTTGLLVGAGGDQARVMFLATPGAAQYAQISGGTQGGEAIGNALLYPQAMSDQHLKQVEDCLAKGVQG
jgi:hypothetical protein